ncbi:hypothetical protein D3C75_898450 [compost metagenome]
MGGHLPDILNHSGDDLHTVLQQRGIGGMVNIRFDNRRVGPKFSGFQDRFFFQSFHERRIDIFDDFVAVPFTGIDERGWVWHRFVDGDSAKHTPRNAVANFLYQRLITQTVFVLKHHQAQVFFNGKGWTPALLAFWMELYKRL